MQKQRPPHDKDQGEAQPQARQNYPLACVCCGRSDAFRPDLALRGLGGPALEYERCACGLLRMTPSTARLVGQMDLYGPELFTGERRFASPQAARLYIEHLAKRLRPFIKPGEVLLDVGCATGDLLAWARGQGLAVSGVEPSRHAAALAGQKGLAVHACTLAEADIHPASVDVITMMDVLEHLPDPLEELKRAAKLLRPGGRVLAKTVRHNTPLDAIARAIHAGSGRKIDGPLRRMYVPQHFYGFTKVSLQALFRRAGLRTIDLVNLETPASVLTGSLVEKSMLWGLFALNHMTGRTYEMLLAAQRD